MKSVCRGIQPLGLIAVANITQPQDEYVFASPFILSGKAAQVPCRPYQEGTTFVAESSGLPRPGKELTIDISWEILPSTYLLSVTILPGFLLQNETIAVSPRP